MEKLVLLAAVGVVGCASVVHPFASVEQTIWVVKGGGPSGSDAVYRCGDANPAGQPPKPIYVLAPFTE